MTASVGRRVAQWRVKRRMTQQVFADRIGRSKSWVEKVERGVRKLDKFSVIQQIAEVLRVSPAEFLGADIPATTASPVADGVEGVQAALACHDVFSARGTAGEASKSGELAHLVSRAWLTYQHADYPQLLRTLPNLLNLARLPNPGQSVDDVDIIVQAYRVTASALVKVDETDLAWLAADRAIVAAGENLLLAATAAISLAQVLRSLGRYRLAMATSIAAAHRIAPLALGNSAHEPLSVYGTLLIQAALAGAHRGDKGSIAELVQQARAIAVQVGDGKDHRNTNFGPAAVDLAQVVATAALGDATEATRQHAAVTQKGGLQRLPREYRAAYLIDAVSTYVQVGDFKAAAQTILEADRVAPAEVRHRPAGRMLAAEVVRDGSGIAGAGPLARALGLT
ncbi:helix-turn-helix domain-containing protein [Micromonospora sp. LOL_014]|uniref:helix-turn-helix domain-containing protein n=1 Tax=Micromonospora sp. LOL_014 TaxID=3345415 RepID=UPI003A8A2329